MTARYFTHGAWWLSERAMTLAFAFITQIALIRLLNPSGYGELAYLLALVALLTPIAQAGASGLVTKALLTHPDSHDQILRAALAWRLCGGLLAALLGSTYWLLLEDQIGHRSVFPLLCVGQIGLAFRLVEHHFQVQLHPAGLIPWRVSAALIGTLLKVGVAESTRDVTWVAAAFAFDYFLQALILGLAYRKDVGSWLMPWPVARSHWQWFAVKSPWLMASGVLEVLYLKLDIVMLEHFRGVTETGLYAAAARLSEMWYLIPTVLMAAWFPLFWASSKSREHQDRQLQRTLDMLALSALLIAIFVQFSAEWLVTTAFGEDFAAAASILALHVWAGVFVFLRAVLSKWLITEDLLFISLITHAAGAGLNIVGNLYLIPEYGGLGAAASTIMAYAASTWLVLFWHPRTRPVAFMMSRSLLIPLRWPSLIRLVRVSRQHQPNTSNKS